MLDWARWHHGMHMQIRCTSINVTTVDPLIRGIYSYGTISDEIVSKNWRGLPPYEQTEDASFGEFEPYSFQCQSLVLSESRASISRA